MFWQLDVLLSSANSTGGAFSVVNLELVNGCETSTLVRLGLPIGKHLLPNLANASFFSGYLVIVDVCPVLRNDTQMNHGVQVCEKELSKAALNVKLEQASSLSPNTRFFCAHVYVVVLQLRHYGWVQLNNSLAQLSGFWLRIYGNPHVGSYLNHVHSATYVVKQPSSVN